MDNEVLVWGYNGQKKIVNNNNKRFFTVPQCQLEQIGFLTAKNKLKGILVSDSIEIISALEGQIPEYSHGNAGDCLTNVCQHEDKTYLIDNNGRCHIIDKSKDKLEHSIVKQDVNTDENAVLNQMTTGDIFTIGITEQYLAGSIVQDSQGVGYIFRPFTPSIICKQVSCGKEHTLLLSSGGQVYSLGLGSRGQLGHGVTDKQVQPKLIEAIEAVSMATISCGGWHSAAVSDINDLYIWGWNESGQLGFKMKTSNRSNVKGHCPNSLELHDSPHNPAEADNKDITKEDLSYSQSSPLGNICMQKRDIMNMEEEYVLFHLVPEILDLPGDHNVSKVSCGSRHTAAVTDGGSLFTWGWGEYGQLGHGDTYTKDYPTQVQYFTDNQLIVTDVHCQNWNTVVSATCKHK